MAEARQRSDWARAAVTVAWLVNNNGFCKKPVDPLKIIPPAFRPPPAPPREKTAEERRRENDMGWAMLDRAFGRKG